MNSVTAVRLFLIRFLVYITFIFFPAESLHNYFDVLSTEISIMIRIYIFLIRQSLVSSRAVILRSLFNFIPITRI